MKQKDLLFSLACNVSGRLVDILTNQKNIFMKLFNVLIGLVAVTTSCTHVYYAPNTANAPLLSEKGETRINALYASGAMSEFSGGELQISHAVSNHVAIMANGMTASKSDQVSHWYSWWDPTVTYHTEKGNGSYVEFAGGYFKALDKNKKWIVEGYSGFGFGTASNDYGFGDRSKVSSTKFFVQPAIGYKGNHFETALVPKFSLVTWKMKSKTLLSNENSYLKEEFQVIEGKPDFLSFEPSLLLRGGGKNLKVQAALSYSFSRSTPNSTYSIPDLIENLNVSVGVSINLKPSKK
jgi:hypothetical protein